MRSLRGASSSNDLPSEGRARCWEKISSSGSLSLGRSSISGDALGQSEGGLERVGEPPLDALPQDQAVDDDLDRVDLVAAQVDLAAQLVLLAVDHHPGEALLGEIGEQLLVGALATSDHRGQHLESAALGELEDLVDDLLGGLADEGFAGLGVVGLADAGEQEAEVVVDLGDRPHRGARVAGRRLLVDGDGRGRGRR